LRIVFCIFGTIDQDAEDRLLIINTGQRTDIPAFYSRWFFNRIREGYVMARNPYYPVKVTRYRLDPEVVDLIAFCTKNPAPMLDRLDELDAFRQFWFVTITPYGNDIEPNVPPVPEVVESFRRLSEKVSAKRIGWRYDPIFLTERYSPDFHVQAFTRICEELEGFTRQVVISFIDLYEKTKVNFPGVRPVPASVRTELGRRLGEIARKHGIRPYSCFEGQELSKFGFDCTGCMTKEVLERAIGEELVIPAGISYARPGCRCLIGNDIGAYNSCGHGCLYCYANKDRELVRNTMRNHDPDSPFLIGHALPADEVSDARQESWRSGQMVFSLC
jgi:hypothetical protein